MMTKCGFNIVSTPDVYFLMYLVTLQFQRPFLCSSVPHLALHRLLRTCATRAFCFSFLTNVTKHADRVATSFVLKGSHQTPLMFM